MPLRLRPGLVQGDVHLHVEVPLQELRHSGIVACVEVLLRGLAPFEELLTQDPPEVPEVGEVPEGLRLPVRGPGHRDEGKSHLGNGLVVGGVPEVHEHTLWKGEALALVDGHAPSQDQWQLQPLHALAAVVPHGLRCDGYPGGVLRENDGAAVLGDVHDHVLHIRRRHRARQLLAPQGLLELHGEYGARGPVDQARHRAEVADDHRGGSLHEMHHPAMLTKPLARLALRLPGVVSGGHPQYGEALLSRKLCRHGAVALPRARVLGKEVAAFLLEALALQRPQRTAAIAEVVLQPELVVAGRHGAIPQANEALLVGRGARLSVYPP